MHRGPSHLVRLPRRNRFSMEPAISGGFLKWAVLGSDTPANRLPCQTEVRTGLHRTYTPEQLRLVDLARVEERVRVAIGRHEPRALTHASADRGPVDALAVEQRVRRWRNEWTVKRGTPASRQARPSAVRRRSAVTPANSRPSGSRSSRTGKRSSRPSNRSSGSSTQRACRVFETAARTSQARRLSSRSPSRAASSSPTGGGNVPGRSLWVTCRPTSHPRDGPRQAAPGDCS